jgi:hypothetical protein
VAQIIRDQAAALGHSDVVIDEVIQHPGRGWQVRGQSGPNPLRAQLDPRSGGPPPLGRLTSSAGGAPRAQRGALM